MPRIVADNDGVETPQIRHKLLVCRCDCDGACSAEALLRTCEIPEYLLIQKSSVCVWTNSKKVVDDPARACHSEKRSTNALNSPFPLTGSFIFHTLFLIFNLVFTAQAPNPFLKSSCERLVAANA